MCDKPIFYVDNNIPNEIVDDIENNEKETGKIIRAISKNVYLDSEVKNQFTN